MGCRPLGNRADSQKGARRGHAGFPGATPLPYPVLVTKSVVMMQKWAVYLINWDAIDARVDRKLLKLAIMEYDSLQVIADRHAGNLVDVHAESTYLKAHWGFPVSTTVKKWERTAVFGL